MRSILLWLLPLGIPLLTAPAAWGQAGRFIPRLPPPGGGGGVGGGGGGVFHLLAYLFRYLVEHPEVLPIAVAVVVGLLLLFLVAIVVVARSQRPPDSSGQARPTGIFAGQDVDVPPPDRIYSATEVANKAGRTERLLAVLARTDSRFAPHFLRQLVHSTFRRVQECWQQQDYAPAAPLLMPALLAQQQSLPRVARNCGQINRFDPHFLRQLVHSTFCRAQECWQQQDYARVAPLLMPALLAQHQSLLRAMRSCGEINRIEDLHVRRLEFVYVSCPEEMDRCEVTALITFEAKVYFVDAVSGIYLRGDRHGRAYQEFWVFRRQGDGWRLQAIERSHESQRLAADNRVASMTAAELGNHQSGVMML
jgi:predicted lipid-binding transport protein (Tim44 family)